MASVPHLQVTDRRGRRRIPIDKPRILIGRRVESDVCVSGAGASRQHAEIAAGNGVYRLRDLGSTFGTYVNGAALAAEHVLQHGDRIRLGDAGEAVITFLADDDEPPPDPRAAAAASELRHLAGLLDGLRALGSGRVLDDVLALVLDSSIEVTGAERGFIMLAGEGRELEFKLGRGQGHVTLSGRSFETSRKIPEDVFATGTVRMVEDLMDEGIAAQHLGTIALGIRHVLCAPLRLVRYVEHVEERAEEKIIGVLYLDSRERGTLLTQAAIAAIDTLSTEAAVAIENARLYRAGLERARLDQELKVAAAIQASLLPASNRSGPFFSTAAISMPCRAIGGDFFDYVDSGERFGFMVGDISGKGPAAALLASAVLGMFGVEADYRPQCAELMAALNRRLFRRDVDGRFLTAFYGLLAADGSFVYTNAGHNAPVLVTRTSTRRLETGGRILGVFEQATFEEEALTLEPGDAVVVVSDGISEARNEAGEEYTDQRLLAVVEASRGRPPQEVVDRLVADVRSFCGGAAQGDDITVVVVRYDG